MQTPLSQLQSVKSGGVPSNRDLIVRYQNLFQEIDEGAMHKNQQRNPRTTISRTISTGIFWNEASISIPSNVKAAIAISVAFSSVRFGAHVVRT